MPKIAICPPCVVGACDRCRGTVASGLTKAPCACHHAAGPAVPGRVVGTSDPRKAGGAFVAVGPGDGQTILDTTNAVILEESQVCRVDNPSDGRVMLALFLAGRINRKPDRVAVLYVLGAGGAAALVSELVGLAARIGPGFEAEFRSLLAERMENTDLWPARVASPADPPDGSML